MGGIAMIGWTCTGGAAARRRRLSTLVALLPLVAACYSYTPLRTLPPPVGTQVALELSDQGRVDAAPQVGPFVARVEGALAQATDVEYVVQVFTVLDLLGRRTKWAGETIPLPRSAVATTLERRFSRPRTFVTIAGFAAAFVALVASQNLLGFGGEGGGPPGGDPNDQ